MAFLRQKSEQPKKCPVCLEQLEIDDLHFYPCTCGYQVCRFCWHRVRTAENGLCPGCKSKYTEKPAKFKAMSAAHVRQLKTENRACEDKKKQKVAESRKNLDNVRVVQNNVVFVVGLPNRLANAETLRKAEFFGKFGKIIKVVIVNQTSSIGSQAPYASAYVTYQRVEDTLQAISAFNKSVMDGRIVGAYLGTLKYCPNFIKNQPCHKVDCSYLHKLGDEEASFTQDDIKQRKHQAYEENLRQILVTKKMVKKAAIPPLLQGGSREKAIPPLIQGDSREKAIPPLLQRGSREKAIPPLFQGGSREKAIPPLRQGGSREKAIPPLFQGGNREKAIPPLFQGGSREKAIPPLFQGGSREKAIPPLLQGGSRKKAIPPLLQGGSREKAIPPLFQGGSREKAIPPLLQGGSREKTGAYVQHIKPARPCHKSQAAAAPSLQLDLEGGQTSWKTCDTSGEERRGLCKALDKSHSSSKLQQPVVSCQKLRAAILPQQGRPAAAYKQTWGEQEPHQLEDSSILTPQVAPLLTTVHRSPTAAPKQNSTDSINLGTNHKPLPAIPKNASVQVEEDGIGFDRFAEAQKCLAELKRRAEERVQLLSTYLPLPFISREHAPRSSSPLMPQVEEQQQLNLSLQANASTQKPTDCGTPRLMQPCPPPSTVSTTSAARPPPPPGFSTAPPTTRTQFTGSRILSYLGIHSPQSGMDQGGTSNGGMAAHMPFNNLDTKENMPFSLSDWHAILPHLGTSVPVGSNQTTEKGTHNESDVIGMARPSVAVTSTRHNSGQTQVTHMDPQNQSPWTSSSELVLPPLFACHNSHSHQTPYL